MHTQTHVYVVDGFSRRESYIITMLTEQIYATLRVRAVRVMYADNRYSNIRRPESREFSIPTTQKIVSPRDSPPGILLRRFARFSFRREAQSKPAVHCPITAVC